MQKQPELIFLVIFNIFVRKSNLIIYFKKIEYF